MLILKEFDLGLQTEEMVCLVKLPVTSLLVYNLTCDGLIFFSVTIDFVGELYLSFFNLNSEETIISVNVSSSGLVNALPGKNLTQPSSSITCTYSEVWSGKEYGVVKETISANVVAHGCVLFVINCKSSSMFSQ